MSEDQDNTETDESREGQSARRESDGSCALFLREDIAAATLTPEQAAVFRGSANRHMLYDPGAQMEMTYWVDDDGCVFVERIERGVSRCTCHPRDSSQVCDYCYRQGLRGHMQR